ncbi:MAG: hypothetical protein A2W90_00860 [Bacteroidetes bacterium GWF2_42_66]|nr:MAG: hypothetical protein A2W92_02155 [Bacteroidetes bacterium GWA2_42_15]OFX99405.1 MAG: hypothetical protein A2W89_12260 [Bacteroidetes bacterium GWE2_42_39]OFY40457.1 MAG: hypothetical protein A2W90_00860 [Bacteroidetes bacterium GWF2_42_66]HBL76921.1 hypothetical protein [Prolixibacteraceae bacterium]HCU62699.1 hypothetical protein [Prolixibacteraceae bacterium]
MAIHLGRPDLVVDFQQWNVTPLFQSLNCNGSLRIGDCAIAHPLSPLRLSEAVTKGLFSVVCDDKFIQHLFQSRPPWMQDFLPNYNPEKKLCAGYE